jgi:hypothetical protein
MAISVNEIQAGRSALLAPVRYEEFDLSVARDRQILGITANTFYVDPGADGSAYRGATATLWIDESPLTIGAGFLLRKQTSNVRLTNAAQSGKRLRLVYGQDVNVTSWFTSSGISLNQPATLVPESVNLFAVSNTSVDNNVAVLGAGSSEGLFVVGGRIRSRATRKWLPADWNALNWTGANQGPAELNSSGTRSPTFLLLDSDSPARTTQMAQCVNSGWMFQEVGTQNMYHCLDWTGELEPFYIRPAAYARTLYATPGSLYSSLTIPYWAEVSYQFVTGT